VSRKHGFLTLKLYIASYYLSWNTDVAKRTPISCPARNPVALLHVINAMLKIVSNEMPKPIIIDLWARQQHFLVPARKIQQIGVSISLDYKPGI